MGTPVRILAILNLISLSCADKSSVDVLTPSSGLSAFKEEDILNVLSRNKTDTTKNFTFVELISSLGNYTIDSKKIIWSDDSPAYYTNPHYGESRILYFCVRQYYVYINNNFCNKI